MRFDDCVFGGEFLVGQVEMGCARGVCAECPFPMLLCCVLDGSERQRVARLFLLWMTRCERNRRGTDRCKVLQIRPCA